MPLVADGQEVVIASWELKKTQTQHEERLFYQFIISNFNNVNADAN